VSADRAGSSARPRCSSWLPMMARDAAVTVERPRDRLLAQPARQLDAAVVGHRRPIDGDARRALRHFRSVLAIKPHLR